jgi:malate/lactate dehydrogenase
MIPKVFLCVLCLTWGAFDVAMWPAASNAQIPDSVMAPLNQLAADLTKEGADVTAANNAATALAAAQAVADSAATAVTNDATTVNTDATAVQNAIAAWIAGGGNLSLLKNLKVGPPVTTQSVCPTCPNYAAPAVLKLPGRTTAVMYFPGRRHILPWRR